MQQVVRRGLRGNHRVDDVNDAVAGLDVDGDHVGLIDLHAGVGHGDGHVGPLQRGGAVQGHDLLGSHRSADDVVGQDGGQGFAVGQDGGQIVFRDGGEGRVGGCKDREWAFARQRLGQVGRFDGGQQSIELPGSSRGFDDVGLVLAVVSCAGDAGDGQGKGGCGDAKSCHGGALLVVERARSIDGGTCTPGQVWMRIR